MAKKEKERVLTEAEQKRREAFEAETQKLTEKGYIRKDFRRRCGYVNCN